MDSVKVKAFKMTKKRQDAIFKKYLEGESVSDLAREYNYSYSVVYRFINKEKARIASEEYHKSRPRY